MNLRAFTLIELVIALAVVLAIMSLVMPGVYARLIASRGQEARRMIDSSVIAARAAAARTGDPVRVMTRHRADGIVDIVHVRLRERGSDDALAGALDPEMVDDASAMLDDEQRRDAEIDLSLPTGCRVSALSTLESYGSVEAMVEDEQLVGESDLTVAILMPDGSAMPGRSLVLITPRGFAHRLSVREWSGGIAFERWVPEDERESEAVLP